MGLFVFAICSSDSAVHRQRRAHKPETQLDSNKRCFDVFRLPFVVLEQYSRECEMAWERRCIVLK